MQPRTMLKPFAATTLAAALALCPLTPAAMAEAAARVQAAVDGGGSALASRRRALRGTACWTPRAPT
mgnify:CR=1 FL=1